MTHAPSDRPGRNLQTILLESARAHLRQGEFESARDCIEHLLADASSGGNTVRAVALFLKGEVESQSGGGSEAEAAFRECLEIQIEDSEFLAAAKTSVELGSLYSRLERFEEAGQALLDSLRYSASEPPGELRARALEKLGRLQRLREEPDAAIQSYEEALRIRESLQDFAGQEHNLSGLGNVFQRLGRLEEAARFHERALEVADKAGLPRLITKTSLNLGSTLMNLGNYREAEERFQSGRLVAEQEDDQFLLGVATNNLGLLCEYEGRAGDAESFFVDALDIWTALGRDGERASCLTNLGNNAVNAGRYEDAIRWSEEAVNTFESTGIIEGRVHPWFNKGRALIELGRFEEADAAQAEVRALAETSNSLEMKAESLLFSALSSTRRGRAQEAIDAALESRRLAAAGGSRLQEGVACLFQGEAYLTLPDPVQAQASLVRSEAILKDLGAVAFLAQCRLSLGKLFHQAGAAEAARERVRRALAIFENLDNGPRRWECLVALGEIERAMGIAESEERLHQALELSRDLDRRDLERASLDLISDHDELTLEESAALPARTLLALVELCHETETDETFLAETLSALVEGLGLGFARIERVGCAPVDLDPGGYELIEEVSTFLAENRESDQFVSCSFEVASRHRTVVSVPVSYSGTVLGLLAAGFESDSKGSFLQQRSAIEAAAGILGLGLQLAVPALDGSTAAGADEAFEGLIGRAPALRAVYRRIEKVAPTTTTVLVQGESGTGKELVARAIHRLSQRSDSPFVAISCPSIPRELLESELFGHEKGAFTGAHGVRVGRIEAAHGGTLFLDEIGDMEPAIQSKLLRFLQEREFQRVGGSRTISVDVRLVAATSRNLEEEMKAGRFREDLYYRLSVVPVRMPPLRERRGDVALLADYFVDVLCTGIDPVRFGPGVVDLLEQYTWPGNVRELRNLIENLATLFTGKTVRPGDLPREIRNSSTRLRSSAPGILRDGETLEAHMMGVEGGIIRRALQSYGWNQSETARNLGMSEAKLRYKMKRFGIKRAGVRPIP